VTTTQSDGGSAGGPTVLRILLGNQLRTLREANGVTREAAGWEIRASESKISRMELGRVGFKERDVADLLTLYGVTDEKEREALLTLAREARAWLHAYRKVVSDQTPVLVKGSCSARSLSMRAWSTRRTTVPESWASRTVLARVKAEVTT